MICYVLGRFQIRCRCPSSGVADFPTVVEQCCGAANTILRAASARSCFRQSACSGCAPKQARLKSMCVCMYVYIYIYIYTYTHILVLILKLMMMIIIIIIIIIIIPPIIITIQAGVALSGRQVLAPPEIQTDRLHIRNYYYYSHSYYY